MGYGRVEASIQVPRGIGLWPAFWIWNDYPGMTWPNCGEIDIPEFMRRARHRIRNGYGPGYAGC